MNKLIDTVCPRCGFIKEDVWVGSLEAAQMPLCNGCGTQTERAWLSAPSITPQGTRPEVNTSRPAAPARVDTKAIAAATKAEVEQKWLRFSDERVAEQHVQREINHKAGLWDASGNEVPIPKPAPITFAKPAA